MYAEEWNGFINNRKLIIINEGSLGEQKKRKHERNLWKWLQVITHFVRKFSANLLNN